MPRQIALMVAVLVLGMAGGGCKQRAETADETPKAPVRTTSAAMTRQLIAVQLAARNRPDDLAAQIALGRQAYQEGAFNDAYRGYRRAADLDPGNYEALIGLAKTNLKLQNPTEGLDWILRAKRLKPQDVELAELEARLYLINGNFDKSIAAFKHAISLSPQRTTTWLNLASAYALMNRTADAVTAARQAAKLDPTAPAPHFALGHHLERAGDTAGAEAEYRRALALDSNNAPAMVALARLLMDQNRKLEEARSLAIKASQLETNRADAAVIAGWILHMQGDDQKAANELVKVVDANPQNPEAWQKLSVTLKGIGKGPEAKHAQEMADRFLPKRANSDLRMIDGEGGK